MYFITVVIITIIIIIVCMCNAYNYVMLTQLFNFEVTMLIT